MSDDISIEKVIFKHCKNIASIRLYSGHSIPVTYNLAML